MGQATRQEFTNEQGAGQQSFERLLGECASFFGFWFD